MKFHCSDMFVVALLMLALQVSCDPGHLYRRLPFNGSMYGKRAASILPTGMCVILGLRFMYFLILSDQSERVMRRRYPSTNSFMKTATKFDLNLVWKNKNFTVGYRVSSTSLFANSTFRIHSF